MVAEQMMREYEFADVTATSTRLDGVVSGTSGSGKVVQITVAPAGARTTRVEVSNAAGKQFAEVLLRGVERRLEERGYTGSGGQQVAPAPVDPAEAERRREAELRELEQSLGL